MIGKTTTQQTQTQIGDKYFYGGFASLTDTEKTLFLIEKEKQDIDLIQYVRKAIPNHHAIELITICHTAITIHRKMRERVKTITDYNETYKKIKNELLCQT